MDGWCRICSRSDDFRRYPLFAVAEVSQEVIANMITCCTDTQVSSDDGLPQQICPDCLITLSLAHSFRRLCRRTDAKLRDCFRDGAPSQPNENQHQQQQQQQQQQHISQAQDDSAYEHITAIKEEVEFDYDYECEIPPPENQWVIQNPRTIREGAMTVVHNTGQYYEQPDDTSCMDTSANSTMVSIGQVHLQPELGESSTSFQKSEKLKKKQSAEPERFSKRIRQPSDECDTDTTGKLEVLKTSRGKDLLALDGYVFYRNTQKGNRCYWECKGQSSKADGKQAPKCSARVTTDYFDNKHELLAYKSLHTHEPDPLRIQAIKQRNLLKECAASDSSKPSEIIRQVFGATSSPGSQSWLSKSAQRKIIKRARGEEHPPEQTVSLDTIVVPFECVQSLDGAQFFQDVVKVDNQAAFVFATHSDIKVLSSATFWLAASTFSTKTGLQRQLFTIHGSMGPSHQQLSAVIYVLMSSSSESLYRQILQKVKQIAQSIDTKLNPTVVLTDFEKPLVNALEAEFPQCRQSACFFHFVHHLFRSVEKHRLSPSFEKNHWLLQNYKRVKAIAFLPAEHIPDAFHILKSNSPLELHKFLDDFAENYIFGKVMLMAADGVPLRNRPLFTPTFWSLHANMVQGVPDTYSQAKEWHYRMARILTAHHADPHNVFRMFQQEHQEAQTKLAAYLAGQGPSRCGETEQRNETIRTIATNFTSYSTLQFLDAIADNLEG